MNSDSRAFVDRIRRAMGQLPEFRSALFWTMRDLFQAFPWAMIKITIFSLLGATLRGAALVGAVKYVSLLEKGAVFNLADMSFAAREDKIFILAVSLLIVTMAFSAWLLYMAKAVVAELVIGYKEYLLKRALTLFGTVVPGKFAPKSASEAIQFIANTAVKDAQGMIRLPRILGQVLPSLITLLYAFPVIIYVDPFLTLMLIGVALLFLPFFYQANVMAYKSHLMGIGSGSVANRIYTSLMEGFKDFQHISRDQTEFVDSAFESKDLKEKSNALPVFLRSIARTEFWSNILLSLGVALVIGIQVPGALAGDISWTSLVAYLIFLQLSVNAFRNLMSFSTKFSRYYPSIRRYQHFVESAQMKPDQKSRLLIKAADYGIWEERGSIDVEKPIRMALFTAIPLSRFTFPYMIRLGTTSDNGVLVSPQECFFVGSQGLPQRDGSLRSMLGVSKNFSVDDLVQIMPDEILEAIKGSVGTELDKTADQSGWGQLSPADRTELGVRVSLLSAAKIVILDREGLLRIPDAAREAILRQLESQKRLTIICYPEKELKRKEAGPQFGEKLCAVAGSTGNLLAIGSPGWIDQNREKILDLLAEEKVRAKQRPEESSRTNETYEEFDDD